MTRPSIAIRWFVDTNVLAYSMDLREPAKQARAKAWLKMLPEHGEPSLSPQVINEFVRVLTQRLRPNGDRADLLIIARKFLNWCDAPLDRQTSSLAMDLYEQHRLSWWDCVLVASALQVEADYLLSEDFQDGRQFGRLRIVDPFRIAPDAFLAAMSGDHQSS